MEQYDVRWFEEPVVPEDIEVVMMFFMAITTIVIFF